MHNLEKEGAREKQEKRRRGRCGGVKRVCLYICVIYAYTHDYVFLCIFPRRPWVRKGN